MTSRSPFRLTPPQQVYDRYMDIRNSDLIVNKTLTDDTIASFQETLNNAQPQSDEEAMSRSLIQYLYRKNPVNFCRFLERSRLNHLILWTEAKCIVSHFNLRGVVYVKWDEDHYECSLHRNMNNNTFVAEHPALQGTIDAVSAEQPGFQPARGGRGNQRGGRSGRGGQRGGRGGETSNRFRRGGVSRGGYDVSSFPSLGDNTATQTPYPSPESSTENVASE